MDGPRQWAATLLTPPTWHPGQASNQFKLLAGASRQTGKYLYVCINWYLLVNTVQIVAYLGRKYIQTTIWYPHGFCQWRRCGIPLGFLCKIASWAPYGSHMLPVWVHVVPKCFQIIPPLIPYRLFHSHILSAPFLQNTPVVLTLDPHQHNLGHNANA